MFKGLLAKKSIKSLMAEAEEPSHRLKKTLGPFSLTALGIGAIIGAGIFVLTGQAAAEYAGPAVVLSFIFAAIISLFAALCYAEFASMIPISGSAFSYAYVTLGEFPAWIIGWGLTLEYLFSAATVASGWSAYFVSLFKDMGVLIPTYLSNTPLSYDPATGWSFSGDIMNLPAICIAGFIGVLIALGIKAAASVNNFLVVIKMGVILLFIIIGVVYVNTSNWTPFVPENTGVFGQFGLSGILRGAGVVFFAYIGFDALSTLAQEARNPQKDLPLGMLGSLAISTIVYIAIALVLTGIVSYTLLGGAAPFSTAVDALGPGFIWMRFVVKIAILAGLTSVVLVMLLGQARIFYIMATDGLLPKIFAKVHKRFHTPFLTTLIVTFVCMLVAGFFPVGILGQIVSMGTLMAFGIVCFGVLLLRYTQPHIHRPFKVPFMPWIPALGTLACLVQMIALPGVIWVQLIAWLLIGCVIYFTYGQKHSRIRQKR